MESQERNKSQARLTGELKLVFKILCNHDAHRASVVQLDSELSMKILTHLKSAPDVVVFINPRDKAICDRRFDGLSFREIGKEFGISGERCRSIVFSAQGSIKRGKALSKLRDAFISHSHSPEI